MDRARPLEVHRAAAAIAWTALAGFIIYGSIGTPTGDGRGAEGLPGISVPDIAQNVLLYVPFGVFGVWTLRHNSSTGLALWARVAVIAVGFSSAMELLQLLSASRIGSPLDVLANVVG